MTATRLESTLCKKHAEKGQITWGEGFQRIPGGPPGLGLKGVSQHRLQQRVKINGGKIRPWKKTEQSGAARTPVRAEEKEGEWEVRLKAAPASDQAGLSLSSYFLFPIDLLGEEDGVAVSVCVCSH